MRWREPSLIPSAKKNIGTVNKTDKSKALKMDKSSSNISDKGKSLEKSRYTQINETEDTLKTVNKSRSNSSAILSGKSTIIEKPSEIVIRKDNWSLSTMSGHGKSLSSVTPDQQHIPRKNKWKKTSDTSITGK